MTKDILKLLILHLDLFSAKIIGSVTLASLPDLFLEVSCSGERPGADLVCLLVTSEIPGLQVDKGFYSPCVTCTIWVL